MKLGSGKPNQKDKDPEPGELSNDTGEADGSEDVAQEGVGGKAAGGQRPRVMKVEIVDQVRNASNMTSLNQDSVVVKNAQAKEMI